MTRPPGPVSVPPTTSTTLLPPTTTSSTVSTTSDDADPDDNYRVAPVVDDQDRHASARTASRIIAVAASNAQATDGGYSPDRELAKPSG